MEICDYLGKIYKEGVRTNGLLHIQPGISLKSGPMISIPNSYDISQTFNSSHTLLITALTDIKFFLAFLWMYAPGPKSFYRHLCYFVGPIPNKLSRVYWNSSISILQMNWNSSQILSLWVFLIWKGLFKSFDN